MFGVIALLCLVSVSHAATAECEDLVKPVDQAIGLHHLEGRRALIASSIKNPAYAERFKSRDSASITFVNETSRISLIRVFSFNDSCQYQSSNIILQGSGFNFEDFNLTVTFLYTSCHDCWMMRFDNQSKELQRIYLFSKRREVEQKELEEFSAQAKCLNLPPPILMDHTKELCPERISREPTVQTEEKTEEQKA